MSWSAFRLLSELGARPGGHVHVVATDLREELVAYVNGRPYLRRELEMPSAALHHAGTKLSLCLSRHSFSVSRRNCILLANGKVQQDPCSRH